VSLGVPVEFVRLIRLLTEADCDFVIVGGLALSIHGGDYVTVDVDFAFNRRRENARLIARALQPYGPRPVGFAPDLPFVWDEQTVMNSSMLTLETAIGRVDLLAEPAGAPNYEVLKNRATVFKLDGKDVYVASIDDLISMKRAAGRQKDLGHIAELETLKRLIEEGQA